MRRSNFLLVVFGFIWSFNAISESMCEKFFYKKYKHHKNWVTGGIILSALPPTLIGSFGLSIQTAIYNKKKAKEFKFGKKILEQARIKRTNKSNAPELLYLTSYLKERNSNIKKKHVKAALMDMAYNETGICQRKLKNSYFSYVIPKERKIINETYNYIMGEYELSNPNYLYEDHSFEETK